MLILGMDNKNDGKKGCSHVTITGMSFITRMRQLEEIELTNCPAATKDLIKYLSESMPETCTIITW